MTDDEARDRRRTERLAQLGTLLAGFAHEIRNPLSTIGLNLQLVKEDYQDSDNQRDRRTYNRLSVVEGEVKRLQSILEEFLGFVRDPVPRQRPVNLNTLLQSIVDFTVPEAKEKGISLKLFAGADIGEVEIDPDQIRAAVVNLVCNAQDACEEGDEVLLMSRRSGNRVLLQVTDTGAGMPPEVLERAFSPYFSTKRGGTGLGLAMVKRIVEEHDGELSVSSEVGRGTQFTITLPIADADTGHGGAANGSAANGGAA